MTPEPTSDETWTGGIITITYYDPDEDAIEHIGGRSLTTTTEGGDRLDGGAGRNIVLAGGEGADTLYGRAEGDTFFGQGGADRFVFAGEGGANWVMDFEPGTGRIAGAGYDTSKEVLAAASQVEAICTSALPTAATRTSPGWPWASSRGRNSSE